MKSVKAKFFSSQTVTEPEQHYIPIPSEEWRPIPRFSGFEASNLGRVRNRNGTILSVVGGCQYEYPRISLQVGGKTKTVEVHALVSAAFFGPTPPGHQVNHKNTNKYDSRVENLEITTAQANRDHAIQAGRLNSKLKPSDIGPIRALLAAGVSDEALANAFCVRPPTIANIRQGRSWKAISEQRTNDEQSTQPASLAM
jgi:hypothetical protein